jgi:hypothetical protein
MEFALDRKFSTKMIYMELCLSDLSVGVAETDVEPNNRSRYDVPPMGEAE